MVDHRAGRQQPERHRVVASIDAQTVCVRVDAAADEEHVVRVAIDVVGQQRRHGRASLGDARHPVLAELALVRDQLLYSSISGIILSDHRTVE